MIFVRVVKDWTFPNLMLQSPGGLGNWGNCHFTLEDSSECDFLMVLNNRLKKDVHTKCAKENVWAIMQEPYIQNEHDWMIRGHKPFYKVLTHHKPSQNAKYVTSHPVTPWQVGLTFDSLISMTIPQKPKLISWISSVKSRWPGHKMRLAFLHAVQEEQLDIDFFGRGINYIEDKWEGLAPYQYSLAIENFSGPDYWTEKLADCFLSWTVPIYFGCTNLEEYFPAKSFIFLNIENPAQAVKKLNKILEEDDWNSRLEALEEARNLVLYKYQFFPYLSNLIESSALNHIGKKKTKIMVPKYQQPWHIRTLKKIKSKITSPA